MHPFKTVLFCLAFTYPLYAADIHVPGDYPTIQQAIDASVNGDSVLVDPGTYVENINFHGKAITVQSTGSMSTTIIDGGQPADPKRGSVATFQKGEGPDSVLEGFSLVNGTGMQVTNSTYGGGVFCRDSSPTIRGNRIKKNTANYGTGVYFKNSSAVLEENFITQNDSNTGQCILCDQSDARIAGNEISSNQGAGIHCGNNSNGDIRDNKIQYNNGGGIRCFQDSSPSIIENLISSNTSIPVAKYAGGITMQTGSSPLIYGNTIQFNKAHHTGGGIACHSESTSLIMHNEISHNFSMLGGGISIGPDAAVRIAHNTIMENEADYRGGGIDCMGMLPDIHDNIIDGNKAGYTGGGICIWDPGSALKEIRDNVVINNTGLTGGGISLNMGTAIQIAVMDNVIAQNTAAGLDESLGGGIYVKSSDVFLYNNLFDGNAANSAGAEAKGGGFYGYHATIKVVNCRIINNSVLCPGFSHGGGFYCTGKSLTMANCTVVNNTVYVSGAGGGGYLDGTAADMVNSIVWNNNAASGPQLEGGPLVVQYSDIQGGWVGDGNIDADPLFVGAAEDDFHLRHDSPCRATGTWNVTGLPLYDFENDPRLGDGLIDMGADEFHPHLYYIGEAAPGGTVEGRMIGWPGTLPVDLWLGSAVLDPPLTTMYGLWYLEPPLAGPISLGPMPATGVQTISAVIPLTIPPPYDVPMQALLFDRLSNLSVLEVR